MLQGGQKRLDHSSRARTLATLTPAGAFSRTDTPHSPPLTRKSKGCPTHKRLRSRPDAGQKHTHTVTLILQYKHMSSMRTKQIRSSHGALAALAKVRTRVDPGGPASCLFSLARTRWRRALAPRDLLGWSHGGRQPPLPARRGGLPRPHPRKARARACRAGSVAVLLLVVGRAAAFAHRRVVGGAGRRRLVKVGAFATAGHRACPRLAVSH